MILHGVKKNMLKRAIEYFVLSTGSEYEDFIAGVQNSGGKITAGMPYPEWLATKLYDWLKKNDISLKECIENKDVIHSAIKADKSRNEGEFYTPEIWAADGRAYLREMMGDLWGEAILWDASCGVGNLVRTANYPPDKLFLSTLLDADIPIVKDAFPDATVWQLDFLNDIDIDDRNTNFSAKLPPALVEALKQDKPIVWYMNPPYKTMRADIHDVGGYMSAYGMRKCAIDIFHQFIYRIIMIKRFYNLSNVYLGIFGPITMFHSKMIEPLFIEFKKEFKFNDGMCFAAGDFSNTSDSVDWIVGYTTWRTRTEADAQDSDDVIVLKAKTANADNEIVVFGERQITGVEQDIHAWAKPADVVENRLMPSVTNMLGVTSTLVPHPINALGGLFSSNYVIRATRRAAVTSLPNPDSLAITEENFWRCVASFGARRSYAMKQTPTNNCQYYSKPNVKAEGYEEWLLDALILFLFERANQTASYRGVIVDDSEWNINNRLFPVTPDMIRQFVTDPVILDDMNAFPAENQFLTNILASVACNLSQEAKELYAFGVEKIIDSLLDSKRADINYANWLNAWDASLGQIMTQPSLFSDADNKKLSSMLTNLKEKLYPGIFKYGFMMDTAFCVEDDIDEE